MNSPRAAAFLVLLTACSAGTPLAPPARKPAALAAGARDAIRYQVTAASDGSLEVVAEFPPGSSSRFFVEPGAEPFVEGLAPEPASSSPGRGEPFEIPCAAGCTLRYHFDLPGAAETFEHVGYALRVGDAWLAPPSTWLLHPREGDLSRRFELRVITAPGHRFASGLPPTSEPGVVGAILADLPSAPYSAMGAMRTHVLREGPARVEVAIVGGELDAGDDLVLTWVREASRDVADLLGAPAVPHALVVVQVRPGRRFDLLTALGNGGASVHAPIGRSASATALARDWRMTHEFVHLGSPGLDRRYDWFGEGLATYVEPIARVRRGRYTEEAMWTDLVESLPLGQPEPGDLGLDHTATWGRTYWGGALWCFLADVEIRKRTENTRSLIDAIRAIHRAGGDVRARWSMYQMLDAGDAALGAPILHELYLAHRDRAVRVDLEALWRDLGVVPTLGGGIRFDDGAPLAHVRRGITSG